MHYSDRQECERFLRDFTLTRAVGTTLMVYVVWRHILARSCVYILHIFKTYYACGNS